MNSQKPEKITTQFHNLEVHSVFHTIQTEGPYSGTPCIFLRLAGCNLACKFCDTDYTSKRTIHTIDTLADNLSLELRNNNCDLLVISGGEPFRQANALNKFCVRFKHRVQIETNGTIEIPEKFPAWVTIVVSPKAKTHPSYCKRPNTFFKFVIQDGDIFEEDIPKNSLNRRIEINKKIDKRSIFLQPLEHPQDDLKSAKNL